MYLLCHHNCFLTTKILNCYYILYQLSVTERALCRGFKNILLFKSIISHTNGILKLFTVVIDIKVLTACFSKLTSLTTHTSRSIVTILKQLPHDYNLLKTGFMDLWINKLMVILLNINITYSNVIA